VTLPKQHLAILRRQIPTTLITKYDCINFITDIYQQGKCETLWIFTCYRRNEKSNYTQCHAWGCTEVCYLKTLSSSEILRRRLWMNDCEAIMEWYWWGGDQITRRNSEPVTLQSPHELTWQWSRASAVKGRRHCVLEYGLKKEVATVGFKVFTRGLSEINVKC